MPLPVAIAALALTTALGYGLACWLAPFAICRPCRGVGRIPRPRHGYRPCRRCRGTGRRLRYGRRIANHFHTVHDAATRGEHR